MSVHEMHISPAGIALIQEFEGCVLTAYPDPATGGVPWTIGYGHTIGVQAGDTCTKEQAAIWLQQDIKWAEDAVKANIIVDLSQNQFDALVSAVFNLGPGFVRPSESTMAKLLNGGNYGAAAAQFGRWINGPNGPMQGLIRRRAAERALFEGNPIH